MILLRIFQLKSILVLSNKTTTQQIIYLVWRFLQMKKNVLMLKSGTKLFPFRITSAVEWELYEFIDTVFSNTSGKLQIFEIFLEILK